MASERRKKNMSEMLKEAGEAPELIRQFLSLDQEHYSDLGNRLRKLDPTLVATIARGSSDHVASYAHVLIPLCTRKVVSSLTPSLVTILKSSWNLKDQFVLAISQGGSSPDLLAALTSAKENKALTVALVNSEDSPLAKASEILLPQRAGKEKSLAATKTVLCSLAAVARLVAEWSEDHLFKSAIKTLPDHLNLAYQRGLELDCEIFKKYSHIYVLSRGLGLCVAQETALKIKETLGLHAEAFSSSEVLHGPREIVDQKFLVIAIGLEESGDQDVMDSAKALSEQGAHVFKLQVAASPDFRLAPLLALQMIYPWLARCSESLGRNPDHPKNLKSKLIQTK